MCISSFFLKKSREVEHNEEEVTAKEENKAMPAAISILELVSVSVRPITLTVRLVVNMRVGHALLSASSSSILLPISISYYELAVALIQGSVYSMLAFSYYKWATDKA